MDAVHSPLRSSLRRRVFALAGGTIALMLFIVVLGDMRRRSVPLQQAVWYATKLTERVGDLGVLPSNLDVRSAGPETANLQRFTWLSREEARALRSHEGRVMVVHSAPIQRILSSNGRVAVFHDEHGFHAEWLSEEVYLAQRTDLMQAIDRGRSPTRD